MRPESVTIFSASVANDTPSPTLARASGASSALSRAVALSAAAAEVGFDWPSPAPVFDAVQSEVTELLEAFDAGDPSAIRHELGDVLLAVCNLARHLSVPPDEALGEANDRFTARFSMMESTAAAEGAPLESLSTGELEERWQAAKRLLAEGRAG